MGRLTVLVLLLSSGTAATPFTLTFNDLPLGSDVLDSYRPGTGASFTSGLTVVSGGVYLEPGDQSAELSQAVTLSFDSVQPLISFYGMGLLTVEYYLGPQLVWTDSNPPDLWYPYAGFWIDRAVLTPSGTARIDTVTNELILGPEPAAVWLVAGGGLALIAIRRRRFRGVVALGAARATYGLRKIRRLI